MKTHLTNFLISNFFIFLALLSLESFSGCATAPAEHHETSFSDVQKPAEPYSKVLDHWTQTERGYSNFVETFQVTATLVAQDLLEHQIYLDAEQFHWSDDQLKETRQKALYEAQSETTVFLSFYTATDENNNLDKSKPDWNIFLESSGRRVLPASIKRVYESKFAVGKKYPYVNAWSRNYILKFPTPTNVATGGPLVLTIAGPLGDAHLKFVK